MENILPESRTEGTDVKWVYGGLKSYSYVN